MINFQRRRYLQRAGVIAPLMFTGGLAQATPDAMKTIPAKQNTTVDNTCKPLLNHTFRPLMEPRAEALCARFSGQVLLVVNTASRCGFTPQFEGLETLHQRYVDQGFSVLGFPSGDFRQELNSEQAVAEFCELNYGVTFPMFEKVHVKGRKAHPFYQALADATGRSPRWNFNKYLIDRQAKVVAYYPSGKAPLDPKVISDIESLL